MIYFCAETGSGDGPVKIGFHAGVVGEPRWRERLAARLAGLQIGNHRWLSMVAAIEGTKSTERDLHIRFTEHRLVGEWFNRAPEIAALIDANRIKPVGENPAKRWWQRGRRLRDEGSATPPPQIVTAAAAELAHGLERGALAKARRAGSGPAFSNPARNLFFYRVEDVKAWIDLTAKGPT